MQVTLGLVATFACALLVCMVALPFFDVAAELQLRVSDVIMPRSPALPTSFTRQEPLEGLTL